MLFNKAESKAVNSIKVIIKQYITRVKLQNRTAFFIALYMIDRIFKQIVHIIMHSKNLIMPIMCTHSLEHTAPASSSCAQASLADLSGSAPLQSNRWDSLPVHWRSTRWMLPDPSPKKAKPGALVAKQCCNIWSIQQRTIYFACDTYITCWYKCMWKPWLFIEFQVCFSSYPVMA